MSPPSIITKKTEEKAVNILNSLSLKRQPQQTIQNNIIYQPLQPEQSIPVLTAQNYQPNSNKRRYTKDSLYFKQGGSTLTNGNLVISGNSVLSGRWTELEKLVFLHGLKAHGKGQWKKIHKDLPTR